MLQGQAATAGRLITALFFAELFARFAMPAVLLPLALVRYETSALRLI